MIVYGDPQFATVLHSFLARLRRELANTAPSSTDQLRAFLIQTGQLEQAVADSDLPSGHPVIGLSQHLTDLAAAAFLNCCREFSSSFPPVSPSCHDALARLATLLSDAQHRFVDLPLVIKIPEGFEFYALYPEQYAHTALAWSTCHHGHDRSALVVGIRSIGTSLSALVSATLRSLGWKTRRITVRPTGPPFERTVQLPPNICDSAAHAIIVDEGPGLSGSSMAAAAQSLIATGFPRGNLAIFPGHDRAPGSAASPEVRQCWASIARYSTGFEALRYDGLPLINSLAGRATGNCRSDFPQIEDLSGGLWRKFNYSDCLQWPAAAIPFERLKFRCSSSRGDSILWKFAGLGAAGPHNETCAAQAFRRLTSRADAAFTPPPLDLFRGFIATRWIPGTPLQSTDIRDPRVLDHIARYLTHIAGPVLSGADHTSAIARLELILQTNIREVLGAESVDRALQIAAAFHRPPLCPSTGDGHFAPHEWLRTPAGEILKLDATGHDLDHTITGPQPIYWDIASVLVEWQLDQPATARLLKHLSTAGLQLDSSALAAFRLAYAAFRMGQSALCRDALAADPSEPDRLHRAFIRYRRQVEQQLAEPC